MASVVGEVAPLVTFLLGWGGGICSEWLRDRRSFQRDREVRIEAQQQRSAEFQRQTLLDLQGALHAASKSVTAVFLADRHAALAGKPWSSARINPITDADLLSARTKISFLSARLQDDKLRELVSSLDDTFLRIGLATSEQDAIAAVEDMLSAYTSAYERLGAVLRALPH